MSWIVSVVGGALNDTHVNIENISYPYPDGAMNIATAHFLKSEAEAMVIIDTDVMFQPKDFKLLLDHIDKKTIVAGIVPLKKTGLFFPIRTLDGEGIPEGVDLYKVAGVSRGFMLIHRRVFEDMAELLDLEDYVDPFTQEVHLLYWKPLPGGHSEDFYFCNQWRDCDGDVLVDTRIKLRHVGSAIYPIEGTFDIATK